MSVDGGKIACRAAARSARLGPGIPLRQALPALGIPHLGPFVLLDEAGPVDVGRAAVPPHPHQGLEILTYLLGGRNDHRDSMGSQGTLVAGGLQWIISGRGMTHAEEISNVSGVPFHGVQIWAMLPEALQRVAPTYGMIEAGDLPTVSVSGGRLRLLAGTLPGLVPVPGPLRLATPALLVHAWIENGSALTLPIDPRFHGGIYVLAGDITIAGEPLHQGEIAQVEHRGTLRLDHGGTAVAEVLLLAGLPAWRDLR